jgi:hypothetical protein
MELPLKAEMKARRKKDPPREAVDMALDLVLSILDPAGAKLSVERLIGNALGKKSLNY